MRKMFFLTLAFVIAIGLVLSYFYWPSIQHLWKKWTYNREEETQEIEKTKQLLNQNKPEEAFEIIKLHSDNINANTDTGKQWLDLLILASEATFNIPELMQLYEYYPKEFDRHEKASIMVANAYVSSGRTRDYQEIRNNWKGRETKPETWFVLDADKLLEEGKRKEAQDLLKSRTYPGPADIPRLVRLALLNALENPKESWDYLTQAYTKDPHNQEVLSYRGKLLETYGQNSQALLEYLAALQTDPKNLFLKDQLAEYYLRQKQYTNAMGLWQESLKEPSLDYIWIKTYFWNKMVLPLQFDWKGAKHPNGKLSPYLDYLLSLPRGQFWNASEFDNIPDHDKYLTTQQSTFWLRLLQYLKEGREKEAYTLLQYNPFSFASWNPMLEQSLKRILLYRKTGGFTEEPQKMKMEDLKKEAKTASVSVNVNTPFFFAQLEYFAKNPPSETNKLPSSLVELLKGPEVFSAAFLAAGWDEAALALNKMPVIPKGYPEWVPFELTQAMRRNRTIEEALKYASEQNPNPAISMLVGEILITLKNPNEALNHLNKIYKEPSDIGKRSAWLMSLIYVDQGELQKAEEIIHSQPLLENDVSGKETLARIALIEKKTDVADKIYQSIVTQSPEAKSYLARKAYLDKDLNKAKQLTEELLREYPTNALLQENYKKITEELKNAPAK
jgi:thioredoxin-like negative regulator of GroEL